MQPASCYVIAPAGEDVGPLLRVIKDAGWSALNQDSVLPGSGSYLAGAEDLVSRAAAVIAVLPDRPDPDVLLELGFAIGRGRPAMLIASDDAVGYGGVPHRALGGLNRLSGRLSDEGALRLQVTAFLDREGQATNPPGVVRVGSGRNSAAAAGKAAMVRPKSFASKLEELVDDVLRRSGEVTAFRYGPDLGSDDVYVPDFAVWFEDGSRTLGNPVVLETKGMWPVSEVTLAKLDKAADEAGVRTIVVVHAGGPGHTVVTQLRCTIYSMHVDEFVGVASRGGLVETLRRERNRFVHSAG